MIHDLFHKLLGLPVLASKHGRDVDAFLIYIHWLMIALFIGWTVFFIYTLIRFRQSRNPKADYVGVKSKHVSNSLEGVVALIEAVLLLGFAIPLWAKVVEGFPDQKESTVLKVIAQQFNWNFLYPGKDGEFGRQEVKLLSPENQLGRDKSDPKGKDDFETLNEMHVPVGKPVIAYIMSKDVIHSFKVIAMRVCQDAIPGVPIPTWFTPTKEGRYQINCAQLCGIGHAGMASGYITVESQEKYEQWLAEKAKTAGTGTTSFE